MWSLYMSILIFGLSSEVHADSCPEREDIFPCYCDGFDNIDDFGKKLKVNCEFYKDKGDFETLRKGLSSLSGKKNIYLRFGGYNISMPSKLFSGIDIKQLIFESCHMYSSTNDDQPWFLGLENHLEDLIIDNSLTAQEKLNIGKLDKLKSLIIRWNQIPELDDDVFSKGLSNLETLNIFKNNIKKLGNNVFSQLKNLKILVLQDNQLGSIKRSMLPTTADRLTSLHLSNNSLTDLPEDIFTGMPSLKKLSLQYNPITTLDESTWSPIWQQLTHIFFLLMSYGESSQWCNRKKSENKHYRQRVYAREYICYSCGGYAEFLKNPEGNNIICDERLNWILKLKKWPESVYGECSGPEEWKDKSLQDFFESRSQ